MATSSESDLFKKEFKRYRKPNGDDMKQVIDFTQPHRFEQICPVIDLPLKSRDTDQCRDLGLKCLQEWKVYKLTSVPGLLVLPNPFLSGYQHYWVGRSLVDYPCLPNVTNLDAHVTRTPPGHIWDNNSVSIGSKDSLLYKLRWVTLGYHYDWTAKLYHSERVSPFPKDLYRLSQFILKALGFGDFQAEAAIVNYYHLDSTLSGHTDHSESDLTAPLISLSFGQSAIFLIGGPTKQHVPLPLLIRSGDVIVMSRESRLSYHGVPKIITPSETQLVPECLSKTCLEMSLLNRREEKEKEEREGGINNVNSDQRECPHCYSQMISLLTHNDLKRSRSQSQDSLLESKVIKSETCTPNPQTKTRTTQTEAHTTWAETHTTLTKTHTNSQTDTSTTQTDTRTEIPYGRLNCPNCEWLLSNWQYFESYLSYSRINMNVRQVGQL